MCQGTTDGASIANLEMADEGQGGSQYGVPVAHQHSAFQVALTRQRADRQPAVRSSRFGWGAGSALRLYGFTLEVSVCTVGVIRSGYPASFTDRENRVELFMMYRRSAESRKEFLCDGAGTRDIRNGRAVTFR
jgi:hypothetical protein